MLFWLTIKLTLNKNGHLFFNLLEVISISVISVKGTRQASS